jgi:hypothetical protein
MLLLQIYCTSFSESIRRRLINFENMSILHNTYLPDNKQLRQNGCESGVLLLHAANNIYLFKILLSIANISTSFSIALGALLGAGRTECINDKRRLACDLHVCDSLNSVKILEQTSCVEILLY